LEPCAWDCLPLAYGALRFTFDMFGLGSVDSPNNLDQNDSVFLHGLGRCLAGGVPEKNIPLVPGLFSFSVAD
jgi:hypothetical protein